MNTKRCSKCKEDLDISFFHNNAANKCGYANYCIECKKKTRKKSTKVKMECKFKDTIGKFVVYEFYDITGECIYIGQSKVFYKRIMQHMVKDMFTEVNHIVCYIVDSFPDMAFLEAQMIIIKQPKYNTRIVESKPSAHDVNYLYVITYNLKGEKLNQKTILNN